MRKPKHNVLTKILYFCVTMKLITSNTNSSRDYKSIVYAVPMQ